jgi:hypothetical protein
MIACIRLFHRGTLANEDRGSLIQQRRTDRRSKPFYRTVGYVRIETLPERLRSIRAAARPSTNGVQRTWPPALYNRPAQTPSGCAGASHTRDPDTIADPGFN